MQSTAQQHFIWAEVAVAAFAASLFGLHSLAQPLGEFTRAATSFDRANLQPPGSAERIRQTGSLSGGAGGARITGVVEYDFTVSATGWYEILLEGVANELTFSIGRSGSSSPIVVEGAGLELSTTPKVGNFHLVAGKHTFRIKKPFWTGFPDVKGFRVRASDGTAGKSVRLALARPGEFFRLGECPLAQVIGGSPAAALDLVVFARNTTRNTQSQAQVRIPASQSPRTVNVAVPCDQPGRHLVELRSGGASVPYRDVAPLRYEVFDTTPDAEAAVSEATLKLLQQIDLTATTPDFYSGSTPAVVTSAAGTYRESGDAGFTIFQRMGGNGVPPPSWFAYTVRDLTPGVPHRIEVDYPDDKLRTMVIGIREGVYGVGELAEGVDTGGEFRLSGKMLTRSLVFWPKAAEARIVFLTAHDGRRAAAARLRVYRLEGELPSSLPAAQRGRQVINYFEEGTTLAGIYGANSISVNVYNDAIDRWPGAARFAGANVLMPSVVVYTFAMYPSQYNTAMSRPTNDYLRRMLFGAERAGVKVVPELHPRADELAYPYASAPEPKPNLLVSKDGKTSPQAGITYPPLYNPLHPGNRNWYLAMIGELADNYRDSPALIGVSLRLLQWKNPTLNNFHSLDWGYDDATVGLFERETGIDVPVPETSSAQNLADHARRRYDWLLANAREQWIAWRCRKIAEIYTAIRDRVRQARPDLEVYSPVYAWEPANDLQALREAGIDPSLLGAIDGVRLVNALPRYGRREPNLVTTQRMRDNLLDPAQLNLLRPAGAPGSFLSTSNYIEATTLVAPVAQLGFPAGAGNGWWSGTVNPPGRQILERFAIELAETDTHVLGDGGNGYALGQAELRDWLAEFHALPAQPFVARPDAVDPVAVWTLQRDDGLWFYAVNRLPVTVPTALYLAGTTQVQRTIDGRAIALDGLGRLNLWLEPYQLLGFKAPAGTTLTKVAIAAQAERARVQAMIDWVASPVAGQAGAPPNASQSAELAQAAEDARQALARGHVWRAGSRLEHHRLIAIYEQMRAYPPGLRAP